MRRLFVEVVRFGANARHPWGSRRQPRSADEAVWSRRFVSRLVRRLHGSAREWARSLADSPVYGIADLSIAQVSHRQSLSIIAHRSRSTMTNGSSGPRVAIRIGSAPLLS